MILEKDNVEKCARMTKIRLTPQEIAQYDSQLKDLFKWVEELAGVDTSAVTETFSVQAAYLRPDTLVEDAALSNQIVAAFPAQEGHCAKVKKVL